MAEPIIAPVVEVGKQTPTAGDPLHIDFDKLSKDQRLIAEKVAAEAEAQGLDPNIALGLAYIENRFTHGRTSPKGATGVMQLMPGTAEELKVDPNDIDQNIKGGITYYKQWLDKYKDPHIAAIAYNAGPGVADKFLETDDINVLPEETRNYVLSLDDLVGAQQEVGEPIPDVKEEPASVQTTQDQIEETTNKVLAGAAAGEGARRWGNKVEASVAEATKGDTRTKQRMQTKEAAVRAAESNLDVKGKEFTGRVGAQTTIAEQSAKEAARLRASALEAEDKLKKAMDNARRYGVLEESVKTTPGGVTQEGGLGSGAMRHSNVMGEVHEANVVRKGTEAAGPGYSQKSRLIVPDKYASVDLYNPEQKAAQKQLSEAEREHQRLVKAAEKAESAAEKEAERLRNLTVKGPTGLTGAEEKLRLAKEEHARVKGELPSRVTKIARAASKIPFSYVAPAALGAMDLVEAQSRLKRGEYGGAAISGLGALGGALSMVPPVGPVGAAARLTGLGLSIGAPVAEQFYEEGNLPPPPLRKMAGGGLFTAVKAAMEAGSKKGAVKASEALGKHEGKTLMTTQADRTKVGEGYLGGPGFSGIQLYDPAYGDVGAAWAVGNAPTASTIINANRRVPAGQAIWIPMIGSPTQHKSNSMVFDQIMKDFKFAAKKNGLDPELREAINMRIANTVDPKTGEPVFDISKPIDILSPKFQKQLNTFDKRAAVADILGGKGVGGKKGSIIDYEGIIRNTTDPDLLDAPTGSLGSRIFTLSGEKIERPDLHPAFPHVLTGEDLGVHFQAAPREILLGDFLKNFRESKGREPGYMDLTRGLAPSNVITEDMLTNLQKAGYKRGGLAQMCDCMHK